MNPFELGIIEGFFGNSWPWAAREHYARMLVGMGYQFFVYAPKDDKYLRREWLQEWPVDQFDSLKAFAAACRNHRLRFGVGLSPFEAYKDYSAEIRQRLIDKVRTIDRELAPEVFCLLFDDMRGDTPGLAATQLAIASDVAANITARRIVMCPTYYSTDPVLERVFGTMPSGYLETLGTSLDPRIDLFWTGPRICSTEYPQDHLDAVAERLNRRPFLWDNYPVNDSRLMSSFLHLRAFTNRPATLRDQLAGHAANPMKQPYLSAIPLETLGLSYAQGAGYEPLEAWRVAARKHCGERLAEVIEEDVALFQDIGLENMSEDQRVSLERRYRAHEAHPAVREILGWLHGEYVFDPECLTD